MTRAKIQHPKNSGPRLLTRFLLPTAYRLLPTKFLAWGLVCLLIWQATAPMLAAANTSPKPEVRTPKSGIKNPKPKNVRHQEQEEKAGAQPTVSLDPGRAAQGQTVDVVLRGKKTHWATGQTKASFGPEVSVGGAAPGEPGPLSVQNKKFATAHLVVSATASLGPRQVKVVTGNETVTLDNGFVVLPNASPGAVIAQVSTLVGSAGKPGFTDGTAQQAQFHDPAGIAAGPDETLYVADAGNHAIRKVGPDGSVTTMAGNGSAGFADGLTAAARFNNPQGVAVDRSGAVYVADTGNHRLRRIGTDGTVTTVAGDGTPGAKDGPGKTAQLNAPGGLAVDAVGNVYIADTGNGLVRRYDPLKGELTTIAGNGKIGGTDAPEARFSNLAGVAVDGEQVYVYLADTGNQKIRRLDPAGTVITLAGSDRGFADGTPTAARFADPVGIAATGGGKLIVTDMANSLVREVATVAAPATTQSVRTLAGSGEQGFADGTGNAAKFNRPRGVAVLPSGMVYVADTGNQVIRRVVRPPVIMNITPQTAAPGDTIKLQGEGFDGRGAIANTVDFAGVGGVRVPAQVMAATPLELSVKVPDNAATGRVRVRTVLGAAESPSDFLLEVTAGPFIADFRPRFGPVGTMVTLTGRELQSGAALPAVTFAGAGGARTAAQVMQATATQVTALVPEGAQTGNIEISSGAGVGRTRDMFSVDEGGFQITAAPSTATVIERGTANYVVYVTSPQKTFQSLAKLSVADAPPGVGVSFDHPQITAGAFSTLKVNLSNSALTPGSYRMTVQAVAPMAAGEVLKETTVTLSVMPAGQTTLSGRVLSTTDEPIPAATVSLDGKSATTDAAGMFLLQNITAGADRPVMVDGRTAAAPNRTYPVIVEPANIVEGKANVVPYTFYLPAIDVENETVAVPGKETVVTTPRVPGYKLVVPEGAKLHQRDGTPVTRISITPVPVDRTPAPLPANMVTTMVFSAQPGGAEGDMPIPVTYPNLAGNMPGTKLDLWNYNHDLARWYVYGSGHVSADGRTVEPDIDPKTGKPFGLPFFSWHAVGNDMSGGNGGGPGPGGPTPGDGDPANCPSCSGNNPVNFATGFKVETETDVAWGGARGGLSLTRTHLNFNFVGRFGLGWTDNFTMQVVRSGDGLTAGIFVSGRTGTWLYSLSRTEAVEGTNEPAKIYTSVLEAGSLGDELRIVPERTINGQVLPTYSEYRGKNGNLMRFDALGRLESMTDRNGNTTRLTYDAQYRLTQVTDPVGRSLTFEYDIRRRVTKVTDPLGRQWRYGYLGTPAPGDPNFSPEADTLVSVTDPLGNAMHYEYLTTRTTGRDGGRLSAVIDKRGNVVKRIEYDPAGTGRVISQTFADRGVERYDYTLAGGQVMAVTITDPVGRTTGRRFNANGYVTETIDALGQGRRVDRAIGTNLPMTSFRANGTVERQQVFDGRGNTVQMTDTLGQTARMEYEPTFNNPAMMVDRLGHEMRMEYDEHGNQIALTNALQETTRHTFDQYGQITKMTDALNHETRMEYDQYGNITAQIDALGNRTTYEYNVLGWLTATLDPLGRRTEMTYDNMQRTLTSKDPSGAVMRFNYDENGNQTSVTDALSRVWRMEYDAKDRLVSQTDPLGRAMRREYNQADELTTVISQSGRTAHYTYDLRGLRETTTDPDGNVVRYFYDFERNLIALTDQRGNTTGFLYDELSRRVGMRDSLGRVSTMEYNAEGNVQTTIDRLRRRTEVEYDLLNRLSKITYPDAMVTYSYDAAGRRTQMTDTQGGTISWDYDDANRLLSETTQAGTVSYGYNQASQRSTLTVPGQALVNYGYDNAGRLQTIIQGPETFTYGYDILSRLTNLQRPNGVTTSYSYDEVDRLTRLTHTKGQTAIEDFQFTFNLDDEISSRNSLFSSFTLPSEKNISPADAANQIVQFSQASFTFDAVGQLLTKTNANRTTQYEWDTRGRLMKVMLSDGRSVNYSYDPLGRRISRTADGVMMQFVYDGSNVVTDKGGDGSRTDYLNGPGVDQKLRQTSVNSPLYFLQDHLGSTVALADATGSLLERINYESFGESIGSSLTRYGYTGREKDNLTGLMYYRFRWYDPQQGRFLCEDPAGFRGGLNLYAYVGNGPINDADPFGLAQNPILRPPEPSDMRRSEKLDWENNKWGDRIKNVRLPNCDEDMPCPLLLYYILALGGSIIVRTLDNNAPGHTPDELHDGRILDEINALTKCSKIYGKKLVTNKCCETEEQRKKRETAEKSRGINPRQVSDNYRWSLDPETLGAGRYVILAGVLFLVVATAGGGYTLVLVFA